MYFEPKSTWIMKTTPGRCGLWAFDTYGEESCRATAGHVHPSKRRTNVLSAHDYVSGCLAGEVRLPSDKSCLLCVLMVRHLHALRLFWTVLSQGLDGKYRGGQTCFQCIVNVTVFEGVVR